MDEYLDQITFYSFLISANTKIATTFELIFGVVVDSHMLHVSGFSAVCPVAPYMALLPHMTLACSFRVLLPADFQMEFKQSVCSVLTHTVLVSHGCGHLYHYSQHETPIISFNKGKFECICTSFQTFFHVLFQHVALK